MVLQATDLLELWDIYVYIRDSVTQLQLVCMVFILLRQ